MPTCWVIAGPNGAGKTTFALEYLPKAVGCSRFINADLIAAGISPLAPERELMAASRIFFQEMENCILRPCDFAFETALAGRAYLSRIQRLRHAGWQVALIYLALPSVEIAKARVSERVKHGGHSIPLHDIERRFSRSLNNLLDHFSYAVNHCSCFMNMHDAPTLIFEQHGTQRLIMDDKIYQHLIKQAKI